MCGLTFKTGLCPLSLFDNISLLMQAKITIFCQLNHIFAVNQTCGQLKALPFSVAIKSHLLSIFLLLQHLFHYIIVISLIPKYILLIPIKTFLNPKMAADSTLLYYQSTLIKKMGSVWPNIVLGGSSQLLIISFMF